MLIELEDKIVDLIENLDKDRFIFNFLSLYDFPKSTITKLEKGVNNISESKNEIYLKNKLFFRKVEDDILKNYIEIESGLSGAPTTGMLDCLPSGKNFYGVDPRLLPSPAAWLMGKDLAEQVIQLYIQEESKYPERIAMIL